MDHYTTQLMKGHGDFKGELHTFKLVDSPECQCKGGSKTVKFGKTGSTQMQKDLNTETKTQKNAGKIWQTLAT